MKFLYIILFAILFNLNAFAGQKAGQLEQMLEQANTDLSTLPDLTVEGEMDARDFKFIAEKLPSLKNLDLQTVSIKAYSSSESLFGNYVSFLADELPPMCFMGSKLVSVKLPTSLLSIGEGAFAASDFAVIDLPDNVAEVKAMAFNGMPNLKQVTGCRGLLTIGEYAFGHCTNLESMPADMSVMNIAPYAFVGCSSLKSFPFTSSLHQIGECAFKGAGVTAVDLSRCDNLTVIGAWAFADMTAVETIKMPKNLTTMGVGAFCFNTVKDKVEFPSSLTKINDLAFAGTELVNEEIIPQGVDSVGDFAFADWGKTLRLFIPSSVGHIGEQAFRNWTSLTQIEAKPMTPPTLGEDVWHGVEKGNVRVLVDDAVVSLYKSADQWRDFFYSGVEVLPTDDSFRFSVKEDVLNIQSSNIITDYTLFDIRGIVLAKGTPNAEQVAVDLTDFGGNMFVVRCVLENKEVKYIKIACK